MVAATFNVLTFEKKKKFHFLARTKVVCNFPGNIFFLIFFKESIIKNLVSIKYKNWIKHIH